MGKKMLRLFNILDISKDGHISLHELEQKIDDPEVKQQAYFLGIDISDIEDLFHLLENPEDLSVHEFVAAAARLKKQAKTIDIAHLLAHIKMIQKALDLSQARQDGMRTDIRAIKEKDADMSLKMAHLQASTQNLTRLHQQAVLKAGTSCAAPATTIDIDLALGTPMGHPNLLNSSPASPLGKCAL